MPQRPSVKVPADEDAGETLTHWRRVIRPVSSERAALGAEITPLWFTRLRLRRANWKAQ
jgi:hypothetical protein